MTMVYAMVLQRETQWCFKKNDGTQSRKICARILIVINDATTIHVGIVRSVIRFGFAPAIKATIKAPSIWS